MKKFYLGTILYFSIFLLGTWFTYRDNRPSDGQLLFGFPTTFYKEGGGMCFGSCGPYFYWYPFILDVLFLILPIIGVYWYQKKKNSITK